MITTYPGKVLRRGHMTIQKRGGTRDLVNLDIEETNDKPLPFGAAKIKKDGGVIQIDDEMPSLEETSYKF